MSALWLEHRVVLSGAHVIPLSQRETGDRVCDRRRRWTRSSRARACCLRRRARHSSSVEMCVCSQLRMAAWVVEVFIIFLMRNCTRFPRDIPIDPLDSSALHFLLLPQIDGCLNTLFSSLPTSASQPGALFGFMPPVRSVGNTVRTMVIPLLLLLPSPDCTLSHCLLNL